MKYLAKIFLLVLVIGCSETQNEPAAAEESQPVPPSDHDTSTAVNPPPATTPPAGSESNQLNWWDSLISDDRAVRLDAMNRYRELRRKSDTLDFENAEMISGYVKTFFSAHPDDFLAVYSGMTDPERKAVREDLASGFYMAGAEFKSYLDEYFTSIQNSCDNCSGEQKTFLKDIRQKIEADVKKKVESDAKKVNE